MAGVRIKDNDVEPGEVTLTVSPDAFTESVSSLQMAVTGTIAGLSSRVVDTVVSLELADDTATAGEDYQVATATLTIPAGKMFATATMALTVLDDNVAEGNETLEVTGTVPGTITVRPGEVVIEYGDQEPTSISLLVTAPPINEGSGAVTMPVRATLLGGGTRSDDTELTLRIADVSATVTDDYTAVWDSSTRTVPAGEFSATANLTLTPVDDTFYDGDEQLAVRGANAAPGLPVNGVRLSIVDNDPKPTTVILSRPSDTVKEGSWFLSHSITLTLEGDSTLTSHVNLTINLTGDTQRSQSYAANMAVPLRIEAGQSSGTSGFWLASTDEDVDDEDENVTAGGARGIPDMHGFLYQRPGGRRRRKGHQRGLCLARLSNLCRRHRHGELAGALEQRTSTHGRLRGGWRGYLHGRAGESTDAYSHHHGQLPIQHRRDRRIRQPDFRHDQLGHSSDRHGLSVADSGHDDGNAALTHRAASSDAKAGVPGQGYRIWRDEVRA